MRRAGAGVDENVPLRVGRHPGRFTQVDVVGQLEQIGVRLVANLGSILGRQRGAERQRRGGGEERQPAFHHRFSSRPPELFIGWGLSTIFCTRQSVISETNSSFGLRQSISCTVLNSFSALPALPNFPMIVPSSSIL